MEPIGLRGSLIRPPLCLETLVSRTPDVSFSSFVVDKISVEKVTQTFGAIPVDLKHTKFACRICEIFWPQRTGDWGGRQLLKLLKYRITIVPRDLRWVHNSCPIIPSEARYPQLPGDWGQVSWLQMSDSVQSDKKHISELNVYVCVYNKILFLDPTGSQIDSVDGFIWKSSVLDSRRSTDAWCTL